MKKRKLHTTESDPSLSEVDAYIKRYTCSDGFFLKQQLCKVRWREVGSTYRSSFRELFAEETLLSVLQEEKARLMRASRELKLHAQVFLSHDDNSRVDIQIQRNRALVSDSVDVKGHFLSSQNFQRAINFLVNAKKIRVRLGRECKSLSAHAPATAKGRLGSAAGALTDFGVFKDFSVESIPYGKNIWAIMEERDMFWPDHLRQLYEEFVMTCIMTQGKATSLWSPYVAQCVSIMILSPSSFHFSLPELVSVTDLCSMRYDHAPFAPVCFFGETHAQEELFGDCSFNIGGIVVHHVWVEIPLLLQVNEYVLQVESLLRVSCESNSAKKNYHKLNNGSNDMRYAGR